MSGSGTTTALNTGLATSMRAIALSASSAGVISPSATRSRRATASSQPRSSAGTRGAYAISPHASFDRAALSGAQLVRLGDVQRRAQLVLRESFSGREVHRSPGVEQLCVRLDSSQ